MNDRTEVRTEREDDIIREFLTEHFFPGYEGDGSTLADYIDGETGLSAGEESEIESLLEEAGEHFENSKGTLGLAIDFVILAEELSHTDDWLDGYDPSISRDDILDRYENTAKVSLTLKRGDTKEGIRSFHNELIDLFREDLGRTNFPSSPSHHTGEWDRYDHMLERAFRLSRRGRFIAAQRLFDLGLKRLKSKDYEQRQPPFPNPLLRVLTEYERSAPEEQGGSVYQALCYGYVKTEWPHLSLRASKVRTGSAQQHRYGDIDGFYGPDLMISVEVKDRDIDDSNVKSELGTMIQVAKNTTAIAICRQVTDDARTTLEDADVQVLSDEDLESQIQRWDYHKQNRALQGMVHFFANIEENPEGVQRLLRFVESVDPENTALAHLYERSDDES